jgi:hypothetical protein
MSSDNSEQIAEWNEASGDTCHRVREATAIRGDERGGTVAHQGRREIFCLATTALAH